MKYSDTELHKFIRSFVASQSGKIQDSCEEYFTIELPGYVAPRKYTYQPATSREHNVELIATGSQALEEILQKCLSEGILSSVTIKPKMEIEQYLQGFFKDSECRCDLCEEANMGKQKVYFCVKSPKCYHQINNAKIKSVKVDKKDHVRLLQFFYSAVFRNKLRKNEELLTILLDDKGNVYDSTIVEDNRISFTDSYEILEVGLFDSLKRIAEERLDRILNERLHIFDLPLKKEIARRLKSIMKKLDEEYLQAKISKKSTHFDGKAWEARKNRVLRLEEESLKTTITVKFLNLLFIATESISYEVHLSNGAVVKSNFIVGLGTPTELECPLCGKQFSNGYATEDNFYVCEDCIRQSLETKRVYSKNFTLAIDNTTNEFIEKNAGFRCSVCGSLNSKIFEFKCSHDGSSICYKCYDVCAKCNRIFSVSNLERCGESGYLYCKEHIIKCDNCGKPIGVDNYKLCLATGKKVCSCTRFDRCVLCGQTYSEESLAYGKCPACSNLSKVEHDDVCTIIIQEAPQYQKTKKCLIGKNKMNTVVIAKGFLNDTLFVVQSGSIVFQRKISLLTKLRRY